MKRENAVAEKSMEFAVRIVKLYQYLCESEKEFVLSKQILRSGTSVGANIREAIEGYSKNDFVAKMSVSLKEAAETEYWLELLYRTEYLTREQYESISKDCTELIKLLTAIIRTSRESAKP